MKRPRKPDAGNVGQNAPHRMPLLNSGWIATLGEVRSDMDYQRKSNGLVTLVEHFWFLPVVLVALAGLQILSWFSRLVGADWIWCYSIALAVATVGIALIFYAKLPLYRQRRFFTFGTAALPENRRPFYRWGYRAVIFAVALFLCLLVFT